MKLGNKGTNEKNGGVENQLKNGGKRAHQSKDAWCDWSTRRKGQ